MHAPSSRVRRAIALGMTPVAVLLAGLMVWQGTNAAFSADTRNIGNSWETGSVTLTDDDTGLAMFTVQNVVPGQTGSKCIVVTASPTVPSTVKTYVQSLDAAGLENNILVTIAQGSPGSFADCGSFEAAPNPVPQMSLSALASAHGSYADGVLDWSVSGGISQQRTYKISWTFDPMSTDQATIDALQGKAASINFEWELQNN